MNKNDPNYLSHEYYKNLVAYLDAKRILKSLINIQKQEEDKQYIKYRFTSNEKISSEDAKRKASVDDEVLKYDEQIKEAEKVVDKHFSLVEGLTWKKDLLLDANATRRKEMEFVKIET